MSCEGISTPEASRPCAGLETYANADSRYPDSVLPDVFFIFPTSRTARFKITCVLFGLHLSAFVEPVLVLCPWQHLPF